MQSVQFKKYVPGRKKSQPTNAIVYSILIAHLTLSLVGVTYLPESPLGEYGIIVTLASCFAIIAISIVNNFRREPLNGELVCCLEFNSDEVNLVDRAIQLNEIKKIEFSIQDYFNRWEYSYFADLNPRRTHGNRNTVTVQLNNNEKIETRFQLIRERDFLQMKDLLIHYFQMEKVHWLHLIELLGISDYAEIQKFKQEVTTSNVR